MAATFHPFVRLPGEIRDMIWDFAVRPRQPSVHHFHPYSVADESEAVPPNALRYSSDPGLRSLSPRYSKYGPSVHGLAVATRQTWPSSSPLWRSDMMQHPSTYMFDHGLWTACRESRLAMRRQLKPDYWHDQRREYEELWAACMEPATPPDGPATMSVNIDSQVRYVTVHPVTDLFVMLPLDCEYRRRVDAWGGLEFNLPIIYRLGYCVKNIAFEFDPKWLKVGSPLYMSWLQYENSVLGELARAILDLSLTENLWVIEHRLRRTGSAPAADQSADTMEGDGARLEFISDTHRFVEVRWYDPGWATEYEEDDGIGDVFAFMRFLEEGFEEDARGSVSYESESSGFTREGDPKLRVLACEAL
ncbi:beta-lactamase-like protein [Purpureocillium lavendulum]|uniref:Beta-lactamase-like protein n=1 Tax=Purpureocillium lavendulum TaxID=1247861 RepID=A0AB34FJH6_9HYPO|nr:beta-lactamase-like protein [Purpureocillium lavendulum]